MKRYLLIPFLFFLSCSAITNNTQPDVRGCTLYCYADSSQYLISLCRTNPNGHSGCVTTTNTLSLESNDVVTLIDNQAVCTNQPIYAVTFVWICSNKVYSVNKQLPANSYDVDWLVKGNCDDCSWSVNTLVASICSNNISTQFITENNIKTYIRRR